MLKSFSKQKFLLLFSLALVILSVLYVFYHSEIYFPTLEKSYCWMDGYAYFFIKNPSNKQYEISVKRDGIYLDKQDIGVEYYANKEIGIFAPCTSIGENKKCKFEIRVGIFGFNKEIDCNFEEYKCNESEKRGCVFEKTIVISNLDALLWLRNHAFSSPKVIAWWDYGKELKNVANVIPIISNPSQSLIYSIASGRSLIKEFESEEKVGDVASFFLATNESEAVCIAKKYNASYAYLVDSDLSKIYWINFAIGKAGGYVISSLPEKVSETKTKFYVGAGVNGILELKNGKWQAYLLAPFSNSTIAASLKTIYIENGKVVVNEPKDSSSEYVAIISSDFKEIFILTKGLEETILIKLFLLDGYETKYFTKVYSNDNVKIYSINLSGCQ